MIRPAYSKVFRDTDGRSGDDKSSKPVDTGCDNNLEQELVITSGMPLVTLESPLL